MAQQIESPRWFVELSAGEGAAVHLPQEVRNVLITVTKDIAEEVALTQAAEQEAAAEATRAEATRVREEQERAKRQQERERREAERTTAAAINRVALYNLVPRIVVGIILLLGTPLVAGIINPLATAFHQTTLGSTADLNYGMQWLFFALIPPVVGTIVISLIVDLTLGQPGAREYDRGVFIGLAIGLAIFLISFFSNSMALAAWYVAPITVTIGYLIAANASGARVRMRRGERFTYQELKHVPLLDDY